MNPKSALPVFLDGRKQMSSDISIPHSIYGRPIEILLVEDNDINQQVATELLQSEGFFIDIASNGEIALEKLTSSDASFDIVLMDLQMPIMDGYEATIEIRKFKTESSRYRSL